MKYLNKYNKFLENQTEVKPKVKPKEPKRKTRPSPFRKDKPKVEPVPKAKLKDVVDRFIDLQSGSKKI
jgi:hypothetical protein